MNTNLLRYPLTYGKFINRFLQTELDEKQEIFKKTTMTGKVNEWLKYGFSINDNPCRKEFIARMLAKDPAYMDLKECAGYDEQNGRKMTLYFPYGNVNVDRSGFWHIPTSLTSWYVCYLEAEEGIERLPATLSTCGGATVWVNDEKVVCFRPFTRNMVKHTKTTFSLHKGMNMLCVCLEDLAERDTDYYFRLEVPEGTRLTQCLPMAEHVKLTALKETEKVLNNAFVHLDDKFDGTIHLDIENCTTHPFEVFCCVDESDIASIQGKQAGNGGKKYLLAPGERDVFHKEERALSPSFYAIRLQNDAAGIPMQRRIAAELTRKDYLNPPKESFEKRKETLLRFAAEEGPSNTYRAVAILARGGDVKEAEACMLRDLPGIAAHMDCSDFYLIAQLYILSHFADGLSAETCAALHDAIVNFRYWIDEPGNDVMWFFSENHALLFHACQYIAGGMYPQETFTASGLTGAQAREKARELLEGWFDDFEREFMTEWNSSAYLPIDTLAFGYLYLMCDKQDALHARARRALDRIFHCLALYGHKNSYYSSYGRSYEKQIKGNLVSGPDALLYYAYGRGHISSDMGCYVPLCLSDYTPPAEDEAFLMLTKDDTLWTGYNQGYENHVNLTLYKTSGVLLSTANAFKPYQNGYQEHIVQASIDAHAQCFVNHPGETHAFGSGRPSYWAGNGSLPLATQWRNTSVLRYKVPESALVGFTHAYFPFETFTEVLHGDDWFCGEKDGSYIYVWAHNGLKAQMEGPYQKEELLSAGRENVWVVRVGDSAHDGTVEQFIAASRCRLICIQAQETEITVGDCRFILRDEPAALIVNGEEHLCDLRGDHAFLCLEKKDKGE